MTHNTREVEETEKVIWCVERMLDGTYKSAEHKKLDILNYLKRTLTNHHITNGMTKGEIERLVYDHFKPRSGYERIWCKTTILPFVDKLIKALKN